MVDTDTPSPAQDALTRSRLGRRWLDRAYAAVGRYRPRPADRDDLAQDVAFEAWLRVHGGVAGTHSFAVIARDTVVSYWRTAQWADLTPDGHLDAESPAPDPEGRVQVRDLLRKMGAQLTAEQAQAVYLLLAEGLTAEEIAAAQEVPLSRAKSRLRKAWHKLRAAVAEHRAAGLAIPVLFAAFLACDDAEAAPAAESLASPESEPPASSARPAGGALAARSSRAIGEARRGWVAAALVAMTVSLCCLVPRHAPPSRPNPVDASAAEVASLSVASVAAPAAPSVADLPVPSDAVPAARSGAASLSPLFPARSPRSDRTAPRARVSRAEQDDSEDLRTLRRVNGALYHQDYTFALTLVAQHEVLFPHSPYAEDRRFARAQACAGTHEGGDVPGMKNYCAGR